MTSPNPKIFTNILQDLEKAFYVQLARLQAKQASHSLGLKKPTLDEQEARLFGGPNGRD